MAATPRFKVYTGAGEYVGAVKYAEDAAALASLHGSGSTVRDGHRKVVWTAADTLDSYDEAAEAIYAALG
jgi:hypothetical protein